MPRVYQDDVVRLLRSRGWAKGAGGDVYFPPNGHPHLHARLYGTGNYGRFIECIKYLGVTRRDGTANTDLVRNGQEVGGALGSLGRGEIKAEATEVIRSLRLPD